MIPKTTVYLVALACLGVGFVGGVIFSAVRTAPVAVKVQATPPSAPQAPNIEGRQTIAMLQQIVAQDPQNYEAWVRLGNTYFDSQQAHEAIEAYEKALAIQDGSPDVWTDLGVMHRRHKNPQQAVICFDEASRRDPQHVSSLFNKGFVLLADLNDKEGAIKAWEQVVAINPMAATPNGDMIGNLLENLRKDVAAGT